MPGLFLSQNSGNNFNQIAGTVGADVVSLAAASTGVVLGSEDPGTTYWRSTDFGATFTQLNFNLVNTATTTVHTTKFYETINQFVVLLDNGLFAVSDDGALNTFSEINIPGVPFTVFTAQILFNRQLYIGSNAGLLVVNLDGSGVVDLTANLWVDVTIMSEPTISALIVHDNLLFVMFQSGFIVFSEDGVNFFPCGVPANVSGSSFTNINPFIFNGELYSQFGEDTLIKTLPS